MKKDYLARETTGAERDEWWARANEVWPAYDDYQTKTDRLIPVSRAGACLELRARRVVCGFAATECR